MSKEHLQNIPRGSRNLFDYKVSFLILDFNKPEETRKCIESIRLRTKFDDYQVVLFSNGGRQDYVIDLYKIGYIDKLILSHRNYGCGAGTHAVFDNADCDFAVYVQNDQFMSRDFHEQELNELKSAVSAKRHLNKKTYKCVDLAGGAGHHDKYSERAHFIDVNWFKKNPDKGYGGPGPFEDHCWSEELTQLYFQEEGINVLSCWPVLFENNGRFTVREDKDGNVFRQDLYTGQKEEDYRP